VADAGGWTNRNVVDWFARYTERVVKALGVDVRYWITINEPMVYVHMHYVEGVGPPGAHDMKQALRVTEHLIRAHATSYQVLHAAAAVQVSVAKYLPVFVPCRRWYPPDRWVASLTDRLFNSGFLEALTAGRWRVPGVRETAIREARGTLDFLGVNFYRRHFIRWGPAPRRWLGSSCDLGHHAQEVTEVTPMGWDVHPDSFFQTLTRGARLGLPILVTENGTCLSDDARRWQYILRHLQAMARAAQAGAKVVGYLYWSLLDNFEWAHGFGPRFGLVEVDYATQARRIRDSARRYAEVCRTNRLSLEGNHPMVASRKLR
jgi:beta-glucosidase